MRTIVLDASPLGMLCHPNPNALASACQIWANALQAAGNRIVLPEITDYEVRRDLLRAGRHKAILLLDQLRTKYEFGPLNSVQMRLAAQL